MGRTKGDMSAPVMSSDAFHKEGVVDASDLMAVDFEYQAAAAAAGREEPVYGLWGKLWRLWYKTIPARAPHRVSKRAYLLLLLFTGWLGGHRYYGRRYLLGVLYTVFFWSGVPLAMCVLDAMAVIPIKADDKGRISI